MKKYSAACDICKRTFEHEKEQTVKVMLGSHKRAVHGIVGSSSNAESRRISARESYWRKAGYTEEEIAAKRAQYEAKHSSQPTQAGEVSKKQTRREAQPLALPECPCCGARFFVTKKDAE